MRFVLLALFIAVWAVPAGAVDRFSLASLDQPTFEYEPSQPLWENNPNFQAYQQPHTARSGSTPFRVQGGAMVAPNARKSIDPSETDDRMNRMLESRLTESYGSEGWEQMNVDGQLRLAKPSDLRSDAGVLAPYVSGGMGVTQLSGAPSTDEMAGVQPSDSMGLRYGAGVAYTIRDELDLTAGYRVNRMQDRATTVGPNDRLNVQMLDFGLRYKY